MQDQDPNKPQDNEFFDEEFEDFGDFDADPQSQEGGFDSFGAYDETQQGDEFGDASAEGWDEQDEGNAAGAYSGKSGGSGLLGKFSFNTIVIAGAVIVGVGVLIYQVMTAPSGGSGQNQFQSALNFQGSRDGVVMDRPADEQAAQPDAAANSNAADATGFMNDPGVLGGLSEEANSGDLPMPAPISNETDEQGMEQQASDDALTPMPSDTDISFDEAQPVPRSPGDTAAPAESLASSDTVAAAPAEESGAPSPALDLIRKAQNQQATAQQETPEAPSVPSATDLAVQETTVPAPETAAPAVAENAAPSTPSVPDTNTMPATDNTASDAILKKLDSLSDRLSVMEQQIVQLREGGQTDVENLERQIAQIKGSVGDTARAVKPSAETAAPAKAPAPKKAAEPKKQASTPKAAAKSGPVSWELRAAQPGRAWVSRRGEREMQSVEPGSSLAGIGQVLRIEYTNGRWTVVGTQGNIQQ